MAGSRVSDATMVRPTTSATATATPYRELIWSANSPSSATHTVSPASSTARPDVLSAVTAASSGVCPASSPLRCRLTMNSA